MPGTEFAVDPIDFLLASDFASDAAQEAGALRDTVTRHLSGLGAMAGSDRLGVRWASAYHDAAAHTVAGLDAVTHALHSASAGLAASARNYVVADWVSSGRDGDPPGYWMPAQPVATCTAPLESASGGSRSSSIPGFDLISGFIGDAWPDGDTAKLRRAATGWSHLASGLDRLHDSQLDSVTAPLEPWSVAELPAIRRRVSDIVVVIGQLADAAHTIARSCRSFADEIDHLHGQTEKELGDLLIQVGATAIISVALTPVTAGASDAVGAVAGVLEVGVSVGRILAWIAELALTAGRVIEDVAAAAGALARAVHVSEKLTVTVVAFTGRSVVYGLANSAFSVAETAIDEPGADLWAAADEGFVAGVGGGVLGIGANAAAARVILAGDRAGLKREIDVWIAEHGPEGYSVFGELSQRQWIKTYVRGFDETGRPIWNWPPKDGFAGEPLPNGLQVGDVIDRISEQGVDGRFAADSRAGFSQRSIPPDRLGPMFKTTRYEVLKPLPDDVLEGWTAPWFEQAGGGLQYLFPERMQWYVDKEFLEVITE